MANSLIREFMPPMPLAEGCAVSSPSDVCYGNVMDSPLQGMPPEELPLIKEYGGLMSPWLKAAYLPSNPYCCSTATSWSFICIFTFLWAHFLVFFPFSPFPFTQNTTIQNSPLSHLHERDLPGAEGSQNGVYYSKMPFLLQLPWRNTAEWE